MASTYTPLGIEKMATGENAGTWGTKTNNNLDLIEQISGGYKVQTLNAGGAGANTTAVTQSDGATGSTVATRVIILGAESPQTISGNKIITFPVNTENFYLIKNSTSGSYTVQLKAASGSGATVTWATGDKDWKLVYFDGVATNTGVYDVGFGAGTTPGGSNTQIQYNNSGSFGGDADLIWTAGTGLIINSQKELRLADTDDSAYIGLRSHATVSSSYTLTMPAATGTADQILVTDGSGNLSFVDNSGGTSWQAIKTGNYTASAGEGVFANTTSGSFTVTLPASPSLGDEVTIVDYAGTFDTNNLTVGRNSQPIMGTAADLTVSIERAGLTLAYVDSTQGWLLKDK
jgi:hypothetical protein|tara:strand:- start:411 stop:1448 length:1038 start_codon:yes stop_codon:yes gene_type:complete